MKRKISVLFSLSLLLLPNFITAQNPTTSASSATNQEKYFDINKNIEIFNSVLKEMDMFYVDSLDLTKTVRTGIDYMLNSLDPYTEYYNQEDLDSFNSQITGEYAGIGSGIAFKDGKVIITEPFEGKPAAKAGLKIGDAIIAIDGEDMSSCPVKEGETVGAALSSYVSSHLKGQPGTTITVRVQRPGQKKPIDLKVTREKIQMDPVAYYGMVNDSVGYISLTSFTDKSAADVKKAFLDLKKQGATSLIFDLRQNGGGILEEAVQMINMFVPKGKILVSTKGKVKQWDRTYRTTLEPMDLDIPLVVLVDKGSASASEIVAGSLQDLDRAVLLGERTYGKGLVQSTREIPYGGGIKVTTSKYYIPSGRCVQAIDYTHRNADGSVGRIPDSLTTVFYTEVGREVRDGGGVSPDITYEEEKVPTISYYLSNQFVIFDWVNDWVQNNKTIVPAVDFSITDADYDNFKDYVKTKDFQYDRMSEKSMKQLLEVMQFEGYSKYADAEIKALEAKLVPNLDRDLETFKDPIKEQINLEIIKRYYYQRGVNQVNVQHDKEIANAVDILADKELYNKTLSNTKK